MVGSGHLAASAGRAFLERGFAVSHITGDSIREASQEALGPTMLEHLERMLQKAGSNTAAAVLILDDHDSYNIRFALAAAAVVKTAPIIVSLFNEAIASQLQSAHKNLRALSPAKITAEAFVSAVRKSKNSEPMKPAQSAEMRRQVEGFTIKKRDWMLYALIADFFLLSGGSVMFFRWSEGLGWIDAIYFVSTIISTVGFGDISLGRSHPLAKLYGSGLMILSLVGVWMTFTLIMDRLIRKRAQLALGRKRYNFKNHIVLCGLGRIGYAISEELRKRGERVVVIELDQENRYIETVRAHGTDVYIGDARLPKSLIDVGIDRSAAMITVINSDEINLEVGLNARTLRSGLPLVLRIFDRELAMSVRERLHIPHAMSTSALMAEHLVKLLDEGK